MAYKTIKSVLRHHIKKNVKSLWTWDKKEKHFKCIFKSYTDALPIYTPQQLLEKIEEEEKIIQ